MYTFFASLFAVLAYVVFIQVVGSAFHSVETLLLYLLVMLPILLYGRSARRLDNRSSQFARDENFRRRCYTDDAMTDAERAERLAEFDGVLFLRTFAIDRTFRVRNVGKGSWGAMLLPFYRMMLVGESSLDEALRAHAKRYGDFVAIGDDDLLHVGATRHESSDTRWQEDFHVLARAARRIVMLPSHQDGIAWELEQVAAAPALLTKTVFLLTPVGGDQRPEFASCADVVERLRGAGLEVPRDVRPGDGLVFGRDRKLDCRACVIDRGLIQYRVAGGGLRRCLRAASGMR